MNWPLVLILSLAVSAAWGEPLTEPTGDEDGALQDPEVAEELEGSGLSQLQGEERARCIQTIFAKPETKDCRDLSSILLDDRDGREVEEKAFHILLRFGGERLIPTGKRLIQQPITYKQAMGVQLLAASKSRDVLPLLLDAAKELSRDDDVRFQLVRAFGYFGDPKAAAILRPWAEKDRFARLALCMTGDFQGFRRTLADHDETHFLLEQLAVAWAWAWNTVWTTPRERRKAVDDWYRHREYIRMFEVMLGRIGETQVNDLIGFLGANPQSHVAGTLYGGMARLASPKNAWIFLPLLDADAPEVQEETARAIADLGDGAMTLALCAVLRKKAGHPSAEHRAVLMRVADLFPEDERRRILSEGLRDMSALVAAEALATIRDLRVMGLDADIERQRGSPVWQSDVLILRRADEALAVARRQRGAP